MVNIGNIVSVGSAGGGGSSSGIQSINSQTGPNITINGINGAEIITGSNIITVDVSSLSGLIGTSSQSGVVGVNGIDVEQVAGNFVVDGTALSGLIIPDGSGLNAINGDLGPNIDLVGVNGVDVNAIGGGYVLIDVAALSGQIVPSGGIGSINGQIGPPIEIDGSNGISVSVTAENVITINGAGISGLVSPDGSGLNAVNGDTGPNIDLIGVNGIEITSLGGGNILIDGAGASGVGGGVATSGAGCFSTSFSGVISQTFTHNLGTQRIVVQTQDSNGNVIQFDEAQAVDDDNVLIQFNTPQNGFLTVVACTQATEFSESFVNVSSKTFTHNLNTTDVLVQVRNNASPPQLILPDKVLYDDANNVTVYFSGPRSGRATIIGKSAQVAISSDNLIEAKRYALLVSC